MDSRFFRGNQQPICVAIFIRRGKPAPNVPAVIHRTAVFGTVEEKSGALTTLGLTGDQWQVCASGWSDPFEPAGSGEWAALPSVDDLMPWSSPGLKPNRTWVYATQPETLHDRWSALIHASVEEKPALLKETRDSKVSVEKASFPGVAANSGALAGETGPCPLLRSIGHRAFDRKLIIADARLLDTPRPPLWLVASSKQIYVVEQHAHPITGGPALVFTSLIPDMDFHSGRGGRVFPLYRDAGGTLANVTPALLGHLGRELACEVKPVDLVAYLAAITAHPGYTRRFRKELEAPGVRVPLTREQSLWGEAVRIGREILWLHTYGERCADPSSGRRAGSPRMPTDGPRVKACIPDTEAGMPEKLTYDERTRTLHVGEGTIAPVDPAVVRYEVSGMNVLRHWFDYRKKRPAGTRSSPLNDIVATTWTPAMTTELLDLLNVLGRCVALEPQQDTLLGSIMAGPLITVDDLTAAGVLPVPAAARKPPKPDADPDLFSTAENEVTAP